MQQSEQWHPKEIREMWPIIPKRARDAGQAALSRSGWGLHTDRKVLGERREASPNAISSFRPVFYQSQKDRSLALPPRPSHRVSCASVSSFVNWG